MGMIGSIEICGQQPCKVNSSTLMSVPPTNATQPKKVIGYTLWITDSEMLRWVTCGPDTNIAVLQH